MISLIKKEQGKDLKVDSWSLAQTSCPWGWFFFQCSQPLPHIWEAASCSAISWWSLSLYRVGWQQQGPWTCCQWLWGHSWLTGISSVLFSAVYSVSSGAFLWLCSTSFALPQNADFYSLSTVWSIRLISYSLLSKTAYMDAGDAQVTQLMAEPGLGPRSAEVLGTPHKPLVPLFPRCPQDHSACVCTSSVEGHVSGEQNGNHPNSS